MTTLMPAFDIGALVIGQEDWEVGNEWAPAENKHFITR